MKWTRHPKAENPKEKMFLDGIITLGVILQSISTGFFLTLDVATHSMQKEWDFDGDEIVATGTVGCSVGFLVVGIICLTLIKRISTTSLILLGVVMTVISWIFLRIFLCKGCIHWFYAAILEGGVACGTAIAYTGGVQIIKNRFADPQARKVRLITASLSVASGSIIAFLLFDLLKNTDLVIVLMAILSAGFGLAHIVVSIIPPPVNLEVEEVKKDGYFFTAPFAIYLFSVNLSFGVIMTLFNSASSMLHSTSGHSASQTELIVTLIGNFIGRALGFVLKAYLRNVLLLFTGMSLAVAILHALLLHFWTVPMLIVTLSISSVFSGMIWCLSMSTGSEFFFIAEDRSLGYVFFGMVFGPLIFGPFSAFIYDAHQVHGHCDCQCYKAYLIFAAVSSAIAAIGYLASWFIQRRYYTYRGLPSC